MMLEAQTIFLHSTLQNYLVKVDMHGLVTSLVSGLMKSLVLLYRGPQRFLFYGHLQDSELPVTITEEVTTKHSGPIHLLVQWENQEIVIGAKIQCL